MRRYLLTAVFLLAPAAIAGASAASSSAPAPGTVPSSRTAPARAPHAHDGAAPKGHEQDQGLPLRAATSETVVAGGRCDADDPVRRYDLVAMAVDITLNRYGDHDPDGRMFALASEVDRVEAEAARKADGPTPGLQGDAIQPPVLRVLPGECLRVRLTNRLDEPASFHVHASALVVAGSAVAATAAEPAAMAAPGASVTYEWRLASDEPEGSHVFHSHGSPREQSDHGLFGTVVVEPDGAQWRDARTGRAGTTQWDAVVTAPGEAPFREFVLAYHEIGDETYRMRRHDGHEVPIVDPITTAYRPGARAINFRSEPFMNRLELQHDLLGRVDESTAYSSYTFGDPATPILRSYAGERVKERVVHGGGEVFHVHHVHGGTIRWQRQPGAGANFGSPDREALTPHESERIDSQGLGPSEAFDVDHECGAGGCLGGPGDYLVHCHVAQHYFAGMWAIWRVYNTEQDGNASTDALAPLPELPGDADRVAPAVDSSRLAPALRAAAGRHLPARGVGAPGDAAVWDWTERDGRVVGEPETTEAWPGYRSARPGERPVVLFDARTGLPAYPLLRPHLGRRPPFAPEHGPAPALDPSSPDGDPALPGANGPGSLCPAGSTPRQVWLRAVEVPVPVNARQGIVDPGGVLFVLAEDEARLRSDPSSRAPLAIRANAGEECLDVLLTNEIPDGGNHPFSKVSAHIHFVRFDVQGGDGVSTGFNYEQTVRPFAVDGTTTSAPVRAGDVRLPVLDASHLPVGASIGIGLDDSDGADGTDGPGSLEVRRVAAVEGANVVVDRPLAHDHPRGDAVSTEFVRYRWYPDAQVGTSYFHDHVNGVYTWQHGLVGALVVEPPGATYHNPRTGAVVTSGAVADIRVPPGTRVSADIDGSFREYVCFLQDGNELASVGRSQGSALNLRSEPLDDRGGPPERAFSSTLHGDPATPLVEAYVGDPLVVRATVPATNEMHTFHLDGHWFRREPWSRRSLPASTARLGVSERSDLFVPAAGGPQRRPGDYLYGDGRALKLREGAWGIVRVHPGPVSAALEPLPGHARPAVSAPPVCPSDAPRRRYSVSAVEARTPMLFPRTGQVFVPDDELPAVTAGRGATPLVLRAAVGDCLAVTLANRLPAGSGAVSLHADGLAYDPADSGGVEVGNEPAQSVAVGDRRTFTFYAHPEYGEGVAMLRDGGDLAASGARGLYGAVVVGPRGVRYDDPTAWSTVAHPRRGPAWRDAALFLHDEDDALGTHRMPYTDKVRGAVGVNYGAGEDGPRVDAYAGDPLRLSVLAPYSEQVQVFTVDGHRWRTEPRMAHSTVVDSQAIGGLETMTVLPLGGAGGTAHLPGTYALGNHREPYREAGEVGSLVVHDPCGDDIPGLDRLPGAATCGAGGRWSSRRLVTWGIGPFAVAALGVAMTTRRRRTPPAAV